MRLAESSVFQQFLVWILFSAALTSFFIQSSPLLEEASSASSTTNPDECSVAQNLSSIQNAINEAKNGSKVYIPSGIYYERIEVNKTIALIGENASTTIIDGNNQDTVVKITADDVNITGFTIRNSGWGWTRNGIYVYLADNCEIKDNFLLNNCHNVRLNYSRNSRVLNNIIDGIGYGIRFISSQDCLAAGNKVSNCIGGVHLENATFCTVERNVFTMNDQGVRLYSPCTNNIITANRVLNNVYEGMIERMPPNGTFFNNTFFHNNFINNTNPFIYRYSGNIWDDGYPSGGNYWSRYTGSDTFSGPYQNETGKDGIGDMPYAVNSYESDRYPLIYQYGSVHNLNTSLTYLTMQSAIDASETLDGHTISVNSGIYHENLVVHKSVTIIGEERATTIIDSGGVGTVLTVNADNTSIYGFTIRNSGANFPPYGDDCGVRLDHCSGIKISNCLVTNNRIGIYLLFSEENLIEDNLISSSLENGILLWYSGGNILRNNVISENSYNFAVFGGGFPDFNNSIDTSNTVDDGKAIHYLIGVEDRLIENDESIGVLYIINGVNVTIQALNLTKNGHGIFCYNTTESRITNITASRNSYGLYLQDSHDNTVDRNVCLRNWVGICLQDSTHNQIADNSASSCEKGISLYQADNNNVEGNTIHQNIYGIRLSESHLNSFFHNNIIQNNQQSSLYFSSMNIWDNGFEGNFWSDYSDRDSNQDGLGDSPNPINSYESDRYPLLGMFHSFIIYHNESLSEVTTVTNSTILDFAYEENNTIRLTVNGTDGTYGFCRFSIPHALIKPEISVIIDNGETEVLCTNYSLRDDGSSRWIYFAYQHSTREIIIVPEFSPSIIPTIMMAITLVAVTIVRLKPDQKRSM